MNCIFERNPLSGLIKEHSGSTCLYEHNPPQPIRYHVNLEYWCGNVCVYCKDRLAKNSAAEVEYLPPWKLQPWLRPKPPQLPGSALELGDDE